MARTPTNRTKVKLADGQPVTVTYEPPALNDFNSLQIADFARTTIRSKSRSIAASEYLRLRSDAQANRILADGMLASGLIGAGLSESDKLTAVEAFFASVNKPLFAPTSFGVSANQVLGIADEDEDE